jgi:DNA mismatch endonuclease Vsr
MERRTIFTDIPVQKDLRERIKKLKGNMTYNNFILKLLGEPIQTKKPTYDNRKLSSLIGRKHTLESKRKMRLAKLGKKRKPFSKETKQKMAIARLYKIIPRKDTKPERMMQIALLLEGVKFRKHEPILGQPDIFIEPNICVFVDGDYTHGNKIKFSENSILMNKKTAKEVWEKDKRVSSRLNGQGYHVIRVWENDIMHNVNNVANNIIKLIKQINGYKVLKIA